MSRIVVLFSVLVLWLFTVSAEASSLKGLLPVEGDTSPSCESYNQNANFSGCREAKNGKREKKCFICAEKCTPIEMKPNCCQTSEPCSLNQGEICLPSQVCDHVNITAFGSVCQYAKCCPSNQPRLCASLLSRNDGSCYNANNEMCCETQGVTAPMGSVCCKGNFGGQPFCGPGQTCCGKKDASAACCDAGDICVDREGFQPFCAKNHTGETCPGWFNKDQCNAVKFSNGSSACHFCGERCIDVARTSECCIDSCQSQTKLCGSNTTCAVYPEQEANCAFAMCCPLDKPATCKWNCYNPKTHQCCPRHGLVAPINTTCCVLDNQHRWCPAGYGCCGKYQNTVCCNLQTQTCNDDGSHNFCVNSSLQEKP